MLHVITSDLAGGNPSCSDRFAAIVAYLDDHPCASDPRKAAKAHVHPRNKPVHYSLDTMACDDIA